MNGETLGEKSALEIRCRVFRIIRPLHLREEFGDLREYFLHPLKVGEIIGLDAQFAMRLEDCVHGAQKFLLNEPARMMVALWPRIRK